MSFERRDGQPAGPALPASPTSPSSAAPQPPQLAQRPPEQPVWGQLTVPPSYAAAPPGHVATPPPLAAGAGFAPATHAAAPPGHVATPPPLAAGAGFAPATHAAAPPHYYLPAPPAGHDAPARRASGRPSVAAPGPYPEVRVRAPSTEYAAILLTDYAGRVSEMTAAMQYMYHHIVAPEGYEWISELLEDIAIVEMRHKEMLGKAIRLLGGDPRFHDGEGRYWDARNVQYGEGFRQQLQLDVEAEREAIAQYERHYRMIEDPYIRQLLVRIIADEQLHLFLFSWALHYVR
jgi:bacterioferritin